MVQISSFVGALALLSSFAAGLPRPMPQDDSAVGIEVAVSAPDGIPLTDSVELASQSAREAGEAATTGIPPADVTSSVVVSIVETADQNRATGAYGNGNVYGQPYGQSQVSAAHIPSSVAYVTSSPVHVTSSPVYQTYTPPAHVTSSPVHSPFPTYGSGGVKWEANEYNDCVQKCIATYGQAPGEYKPSATNAGTYGTGATHTVIVAPTQGVLRYIPFAVNASVGDTVKFMWGANTHTVTKSSALLPCNRTGDALFASGVQDKGFVFTQIVNDTNPTYFHCATPGHCQKGMFGIINPAINFASTSSVGMQMKSIAEKSPTVAGYSALTAENTKNNTKAARWGSNIDLQQIPEWAKEYVAENVLYTRNFLAANPESLQEDGSIDLSTSEAIPLAIPQDIAAALNNAGSAGETSSASAASTSASAAAVSSPTPSGTTAPQVNPDSGASALASPKVLLALVAVVATMLSL